MTRSLKLCFAGLLTIVGPACSNVEVKSRVMEGTYCSAGDESPYYQCDALYSRLVCIQTYSLGEKNTPVRLCRRPCATRADCGLSTQVCCAGPIVHEDYGFSKACVPRDLCKTDPAALLEPPPVTPVTDAGLQDDAPIAPTGGSDAHLDASDFDVTSDI